MSKMMIPEVSRTIDSILLLPEFPKSKDLSKDNSLMTMSKNIITHMQSPFKDRLINLKEFKLF